MPGPPIQIDKPDKFVGVATPLEVVVTAPGATLSKLQIVLEQNGKQTPLYTQGDTAGAPPTIEGDRIHITREIGKQTVPDLKSGPAKIIVTAARQVVRNIRTVESTVTRDVQVRLERPRVSVVSTHHYINLGGTEMVVYRVTPERRRVGRAGRRRRVSRLPGDRGARRGRHDHRPVAARRVLRAALRPGPQHADARLRARRRRQHRARRLRLHRASPSRSRRAASSWTTSSSTASCRPSSKARTEVKPEGDTLAKFLVINGELRRKNAEKIAAIAKQTAPEMLWGGVVFHPFTNSAVESAFADQRTYVYKGKEVDQQTHLGFDLASLAGNPVVAANRGKVLYAEELGIYGNCVIIDHGMGVQSLYAHLSSIDVKAGDMVEQGADARPQRHDRPGRRRSPALHDAGERQDGEPGRVVGPALDRRTGSCASCARLEPDRGFVIFS